jgi:hypothetical protein
MRSHDAIVAVPKVSAGAMQEAEIDAMIAMIDYLIPQARTVSPKAAMQLHLARHELLLSKNIGNGRVTRLLS